MSGFNLNDMFSKETVMNKTKNVQVLKLPISSIESNFSNFYPIISNENENEFNALKESISKEGLLSPILVYQVDNSSYKVISGHRRLEAHIQLGKPTIPAIVDASKFENEYDEQIKIISANIQREKTPDIIQQEVNKLSFIYDIYKEKGLISSGMLKRDWIGLKIGRTGRTVQNYLTPDEEEKTKSPKKEKSLIEKQFDSLDKIMQTLEKIENNIHDVNYTHEDEVNLNDKMSRISLLCNSIKKDV